MFFFKNGKERNVPNGKVGVPNPGLDGGLKRFF